MNRSLPYLLLILFGVVPSPQSDSIILSEPIATLGTVNEDIFLERPIDFCAGGGDTVYVLDNRALQVIAYDRSGNYLFRFGRQGSGPGEFAGPSAIAFVAGRVVIADNHLHRISLFTSGGLFLQSQPFAYIPVSLAAWDTKVLIGTRSGEAIVWSLDIHSPSEVKPLVFRDGLREELRNPWSGRQARPFLAVRNDNLFVMLWESGTILHWNLTHMSRMPRIIHPNGPLLVAQQERNEETLDSLPRAARGNVGFVVFYSLAILQSGELLVEMVVPGDEGAIGRIDVAVILDSQTGNQIGPVIHPHYWDHWMLRVLDDDTWAWCAGGGTITARSEGMK